MARAHPSTGQMPGAAIIDGENLPAGGIPPTAGIGFKRGIVPPEIRFDPNSEA
jgi:hypothetical protein